MWGQEVGSGRPPGKRRRKNRGHKRRWSLYKLRVKTGCRTTIRRPRGTLHTFLLEYHCFCLGVHGTRFTHTYIHVYIHTHAHIHTSLLDPQLDGQSRTGTQSWFVLVIEGRRPGYPVPPRPTPNSPRSSFTFVVVSCFTHPTLTH